MNKGYMDVFMKNKCIYMLKSTIHKCSMIFCMDKKQRLINIMNMKWNKNSWFQSLVSIVVSSN